MDCQEGILIQKVSEIYEKISRLENLKPSKHVNFLFTQLVILCMPQCHIEMEKMSPRIQEMRSKLIKLCGEAEGHLEAYFSTLIGTYENPVDHIRLFPYYSNYVKLSQLEFSLLGEHYVQIPKLIAFVGSGPLPLTSIIMATNHLRNTTFHNYDIDSSANSKALHLVLQDPDLSKRMFFHTTDIMNVSGSLKEYDVVFLAALVGMDNKKKVQVIDHLAEHMAPGAFLLLRSAHGARAFLYPVIDPHALNGFEVLTVFHPTDEVINSVIVSRKIPTLTTSCSQGLSSTLFSSKCSDICGFNSLSNGNRFEELTVDEQQS